MLRKTWFKVYNRLAGRSVGGQSVNKSNSNANLWSRLAGLNVKIGPSVLDLNSGV